MGRERRLRQPAAPARRRAVDRGPRPRIDAAIETAPGLLASGFGVDLADDFGYEVATAPTPLEGPPGGGLRFVVVARLAGTELVRFKVDVSAADVVVGELEAYLSDPVLERLGFERARFPVFPISMKKGWLSRERCLSTGRKV